LEQKKTFGQGSSHKKKKKIKKIKKKLKKCYPEKGVFSKVALAVGRFLTKACVA
jgi:hypothetical protein